MTPTLHALADGLPTVAPLEAALGRVLARAAWAQDARLRLGVTGQAAAEPNEHAWLAWAGAGLRLAVCVPLALDNGLSLLARARHWPAKTRVRGMALLLRERSPHLSAALEAMGLTLVWLDPAAPGFPPAPTMSFSGVYDSARLHGQLQCLSRAALDHLDAWLPRGGGAEALAGLPMPVALVLGARRMSLQQLASLQPGDTVLGHSVQKSPQAIAARPGFEGRISVWLRPGAGAQRPALAGWIEGGWLRAAQMKWISAGEFENMVTQDGDDTTPSADSPAPPHGVGHALKALEVCVQIELPLLRMTVGELAALREGCVVELPLPLQDAVVDLRVGDRCWAQARLVAVGDRLGAQLQSIDHERHQP